MPGTISAARKLCWILPLAACSDPTGLPPVSLLSFAVQPVDLVAGTTMPTVRVVAVDSAGSAVDVSGSVVRLRTGNDVSGLEWTAPFVGGGADFSDLRFDAVSVGASLSASFGDIEVRSQLFDVVADPDLITINGAWLDTVGLFIDGQSGAGPFNDRPLLAGELTVNTIAHHSVSGDRVVGFARDRAPTLASVDWTRGRDSVHLALEDPVAISLTVWVVSGSFSEMADQIREAVQWTQQVWSDERAGIVFDSVDIIDATANPSAVELATWRDDVDGRYADDIGFRQGQINVYSVNRIELSDGRNPTGIAIGHSVNFVIASAWESSTFIHELGHNMGLGHVSNVGFDWRNVMFSGGGGGAGRQRFFTEGQIFRMHADPFSALNAVYDARGGRFQTICPASEATALCPQLSARIWHDIEGVDPSSSRLVVMIPSVECGGHW